MFSGLYTKQGAEILVAGCGSDVERSYRKKTVIKVVSNETNDGLRVNTIDRFIGMGLRCWGISFLLGCHLLIDISPFPLGEAKSTSIIKNLGNVRQIDNSALPKDLVSVCSYFMQHSFDVFAWKFLQPFCVII